jgi:hypothetical protein
MRGIVHGVMTVTVMIGIGTIGVEQEIEMRGIGIEID